MLFAVRGGVTAAPETADLAVLPAVRFIDLNDDGLLDLLSSDVDHMTVSMNRGTGVFDPTGQKLPRVSLAEILVSDFNGDGIADLYLLSQGDNVALVGDGLGRFHEGTEELGLADSGHGLMAERVVLDQFGAAEVLLHNVDGDVLFWATGNGFERAGVTPVKPQQDELVATDLESLERSVVGAAELLALDPDEELVLGLDEAGRPQVSLGLRRLVPGDNFSGQSVVSPSGSGNTPVATTAVGASGGTTGPGTGGGDNGAPPG
ncbi:MAG: hypothetical protein ACI9EF_001113 [Pseudohongiellaceae bacterium]|jgi:hypothetical protein